MQGIWKENVSGWNHKDSKRKKQSRKHFIRDKKKSFNKLFNRKEEKLDSNKLRYESTLQKTFLYLNNELISEQDTLFLAHVTYRNDFRCYKEGFNEYNTIPLKIYFFKNIFSEEIFVGNTGKSLPQYLNLDTFYFNKMGAKTSLNNLFDLFAIEVNLLKPVKLCKWDTRLATTKIEFSVTRNSKLFFYNKLVSRYMFKKRKSPYWQYDYHSSLRQKFRNWKNKRDYDSDFKFPIKPFFGWEYY